jgi:hypothetical protein
MRSQGVINILTLADSSGTGFPKPRYRSVPLERLTFCQTILTPICIAYLQCTLMTFLPWRLCTRGQLYAAVLVHVNDSIDPQRELAELCNVATLGYTIRLLSA